MGSENFYQRELKRLHEAKRKDNNGLLSPSELEACQEAFVKTIPGFSDLSELGVILLGQIAIVLPIDPVSESALRDYSLRHSCSSGIRAEITNLKTQLRGKVQIEVYGVTDRQGEKAWFLGSWSPELNLTGREFQAGSMLAAGFSINEIAVIIGRSSSVVGGQRDGLYKKLNARGGLEAAILLAEKGVIDVSVVEGRINPGGFRCLSPRQHKLMETLIAEPGLPDKGIGKKLSITPGTVHNHLYMISTILMTNGDCRPNRIALGVGYWLYKQGKDN